ncbi:PREDICTED: mesoderm posterior protein 1-like [Nanorana parkeri]|uniref:mesoderm posterior protein 1-like n=1 Tax=Nanorana parkeri TaxID=125878 RepID=UPI000854101B|nr:PREDICTED: mesoderm posterior protein 1-like [Nanorana parkeri]
MDLCPAQLQFQEKRLLPGCTPLQQLGYSDSEGYSSLSPTSSIDSFNFSPPYQSCAFSEGPYNSFQNGLPQSKNLQTKEIQLPTKSQRLRNRTLSIQRHSASEREKMRMRNLSTALQNLRRYLPDAVAPVGKSLTKIETLRLTIRYISHLSDVLGLDDETLEKRREERLRRSRCPVGLNCCQGEMHELCSLTSAEVPQIFSHCITASQMCPEPANQEGMDTDYLLPAMPSPQFSDHGLPEELDNFSPCAMSSTPVHSSTVSDLKEDMTSNPPISPDLGFCQDMIDDMWDELEIKDQCATFQNQQSIQMQAFC